MVRIFFSLVSGCFFILFVADYDLFGEIDERIEFDQVKMRAREAWRECESEEHSREEMKKSRRNHFIY